MRNMFLTFACLGVFACANQACKIEERKDIVMTGNEKTTSQKKDLTSRVFVYKLDGSLQCEQGGKVSLDTMKKELDGIEVFSSENKHDGMMRIQVCGAPTGFSNVYEIDQKDLEKALKLGFKKWMN
ncbi:MAG: hypothetical protein K0R29_1453 [Pseudobdellovibrio sp.]|jgi:hypothetical protein|nr:hypothetical protein [Pseudobdellovibrio sp.]